MIFSNSSTLILVAKISLLKKFLDAYGAINITNIVYSEIESKKSFENILIQKEVEKNNIKIQLVSEEKYLSLTKEFNIDEGEASTFALSKQNPNSLILTDDKKLINLCKIEQKKFINSMAIVVKMFEEKMIDKKNALEKLDKLFSYGRYSIELYQYFKKQMK